MSAAITRNYRLVGPEVEKAVVAGLASARWCTPAIGRAELKELMRMLGQPGGHVRRPRLPITDPHSLAEMRQVLLDEGLLAVAR